MTNLPPSSLNKSPMDRILYIDEIPFFEAEVISTAPSSLNHLNPPIEQKIQGEPSYFLAPESFYGKVSTDDESYFNFPCILESDGVTPWHEANQYLWSLLFRGRDAPPFESINAKARALLKYKRFIEERFDNDLLSSFKATRPARRATYAYYAYLLEHDVAAATLNINTGTVYEFYKWLSNEPGVKLDIDRVDATETAWVRFKTANPQFANRKQFGKVVTVRSQTRYRPGPKPVARGFVRDEGEDLRPLQGHEQQTLLAVLSTDRFDIMTRLIFRIALDSGARKQTILTIRKRHVEQLRKQRPDGSGCCRLQCGPLTGINTKNSKRLSIYLPQDLIERLYVLIRSDLYARRSNKFRDKNPGVLNDDDMYVFLSQKGECLYMAKEDPRYRKTRYKPKGEYLAKLTGKIKSTAGRSFPKDFTFHWTRATFAYRYYLYLREATKAGLIEAGDEIAFVQTRLAHQDRKTTERYLRLFKMQNKTIEMTEKHELRIFPSVSMDNEPSP